MAYAYQFTRVDPVRSARCARLGIPDTGWIHYHTGDTFAVVVSEEPRVLGSLRIPGTRIEPYTGDEECIDFFDAWPMMRNQVKPEMTVDEWFQGAGRQSW